MASEDRRNVTGEQGLLPPRPCVTGCSQLHRFALAAILLLAAALRLIDINHSFWIDEILSYEVATGSLKDAIKHAYLPLSYVLTYVAMRFGDTESILRLPSLIAGVFAIYLLYKLVSEVHSQQAGLVAALLISTSTFHIQYSQDGRYYSLLALSGIATAYALLLTHRKASWRTFAIYGVIVILSSLNHPFYLPFLLSINISLWLYVTLIRQPQNIVRRQWLSWHFLTTILSMLPLAALFIAYCMNTRLPQNGVVERTTFLLSPAMYLHVQAMHLGITQAFFNNTLKTVILLVCAGAGVVALFRTHRLFAALAIGTIVLFPIPLFFINVSHWYVAKYFLSQLFVWMSVIAIGIVELPYLMAGLLATLRKQHSSEVRPRRLLGVGTPISITILLLVLSVEPLTYFYVVVQESYPWKKLAASVADYASDDDLVMYYTSEYGDPRYYSLPAKEQVAYTLKYYLRRNAPFGMGHTVPERHYGVATSEELRHYMLNNANNTIWLLQEQRYPSVKLSTVQDKLFEIVRQEPDYTLRVLGRPTINIVRNGGFETSEPVCLQNGAMLANRNAFAGEKCLRLSAVAETIPTTATLAVSLTSTSLHNSDWSLSARVRYKDIPTLTAFGAGYMMLTGTRKDGQPYKRLMAEFPGTREWHLRVFKLNPSIETELQQLSTLDIEFGVVGSRGTLWVDNVQLEHQRQPTIFVDGVRPPHDKVEL